jgi:hypothetical protein
MYFIEQKMKATPIRITRTPELSDVIKSLKKFYKGMTENEIIKKALIDDYRQKFPYRHENFSDLESESLNALTEIKTGNCVGPFTKKESLDYLESFMQK